jgi:hypothetical protein
METAAGREDEVDGVEGERPRVGPEGEQGRLVPKKPFLSWPLLLPPPLYSPPLYNIGDPGPLWLVPSCPV